MKFTYRPNPRFQFEFDAASDTDAFAQLASIDELFQDEACGLCKSKNVHFAHRVSGKFPYCERKCLGCGARLAFGKTEDGGRLFPKRKLKDGQPDMENGTFGEHRGWHRFVPQPKGGK
jgi:hypothetical protein